MTKLGEQKVEAVSNSGNGAKGGIQMRGTGKAPFHTIASRPAMRRPSFEDPVCRAAKDASRTPAGDQISQLEHCFLGWCTVARQWNRLHADEDQNAPRRERVEKGLARTTADHGSLPGPADMTMTVKEQRVLSLRELSAIRKSVETESDDRWGPAMCRASISPSPAFYIPVPHGRRKQFARQQHWLVSPLTGPVNICEIAPVTTA